MEVVNEQMLEEVKELLHLFGVPYADCNSKNPPIPSSHPHCVTHCETALPAV